LVSQIQRKLIRAQLTYSLILILRQAPRAALQRASDQRVGSLEMMKSLAVETLAVETLVEMIADHR
jgi:hypothetical protein